MANATVEERLTALETEIQRLKQERSGTEETLPQNEVPWWKRIVGVYKDDPEFVEAMRLGREYRESLRPKADEEAA